LERFFNGIMISRSDLLGSGRAETASDNSCAPGEAVSSKQRLPDLQHRETQQLSDTHIRVTTFTSALPTPPTFSTHRHRHRHIHHGNLALQHRLRHRPPNRLRGAGQQQQLASPPNGATSSLLLCHREAAGTAVAASRAAVTALAFNSAGQARNSRVCIASAETAAATSMPTSLFPCSLFF
jgi:hypothetical protein